MLDISALSNLATGAGTLVLAAATFASIRSANRSARIAERALRQGMRPVLVQSRLDDRMEKIVWGDRHWAHLEGGQAVAHLDDNGNVYLAISIRNVGAGIGVLQAWHLHERPEDTQHRHRPLDEFRTQQRDIYVAPGDVSFWQAGLRDRSEHHVHVRSLVEQRKPFNVDVLYSDHEGGQRTVTRFSVFPRGDDGWLPTVTRHWNLDGIDPHPVPAEA
jgi:hypothetical protein